MNYKNAIPFVFLFLFIVLSVPTHAYFDVDINNSYTGGRDSMRSLDCTNATGTVYCYLVTKATNITIDRFDANMENGVYCDTGYSATYQYNGFSIVNDTHGAIVIHGVSDTAYLVPLNNFTDNLCRYGSGYALGNSAWLLDGGFYDTGSASSGFVYWGMDANARNSTTGTAWFNSYWGNDVRTITHPNESDNSSAFAMKRIDLNPDWSIYEYTSGVQLQNLSSIAQAYGVGSYTWDLVKMNASTTLIYFMTNSPDRLYVANFTEWQTIGASAFITPVQPLTGQTSYSSPENLILELTTGTNGTLYFYFDDDLLSIVTINDTMDAERISAVTPALTNGQTYTWDATFIDEYNNGWSMLQQSFTYNLNNPEYYVSHPADAIALGIGGFFSITDLTTSRQLASILLSIVGGLATIIIISLISRGKMDAGEMALIFGLTFLGLLLMFSLAGWFDTWFFIGFMILVALAFIKIGGLGD